MVNRPVIWVAAVFPSLELGAVSASTLVLFDSYGNGGDSRCRRRPAEAHGWIK
jgi:hypothetical protein